VEVSFDGSAHGAPEATSKPAAKHDVARGFERRGADGAPAARHIQDSFAEEIGAALYAAPNEQPGEHLHFRRRETLLDEVGMGTSLVAKGAKLVQGRSFQTSIGPWNLKLWFWFFENKELYVAWPPFAVSR
jgi:hypothetical protein